AWLYGYYADQDADPVVDFAKLTAQGTKLAEACKAAPTKDIISVAEGIYEAK
ncbi:MAG: HdeA/HdeB family, partial [Hyphomicrobiales bacterium]